MKVRYERKKIEYTVDERSKKKEKQEARKEKYS